ncbi:hypothetical protein ACO0SA_001211 [Hanseniaspora valbyensis]
MMNANNGYLTQMMQQQPPQQQQQQMPLGNQQPVFNQQQHAGNFQMNMNHQQPPQHMVPPGLGMAQQQQQQHMFNNTVPQPMQQKPQMYPGINQQPHTPNPMLQQPTQINVQQSMITQQPIMPNLQQPNTLNNPDYHPVLKNPELMKHTGWELQMFLATVSRNVMGNEGTAYAIQSVIDLTPQQLGGTNVSSLQNELSNSLVNATKASLIELSSSTAAHDENASSSATSANQLMSPQQGYASPSVDFANPSSMLMQHKKLTQYNIDDEDDETLHQKTDGDDSQLWHVLDLSNIALSMVSDRLMNFEFLNRLYLNGTGIKKLPKSIKKLSNLRILDLSNNQLTELPSEIGFLHNLKYLYIFDNHIKTLPWEFGFLISLQFLGFDGNPIDQKILDLYLEKNITGLIFYLRDHRPLIPLKKKREFLELDSHGEVTGNTASDIQELTALNPKLKNNTFTLLSYNTLCQHYATPKMYRYTTKYDLTWTHRLELLKAQIEEYQADVLCLQEVEAKTYEDVWEPMMTNKGYKGIFFAKGRARTSAQKDAKKVDGCCLFYKKDEFELLYHKECEFGSIWMQNTGFSKTEDFFNRAIGKDNVVIYCHMLHKKSQKKVWVCTTHLHWDPKFNDVKAFQVGVLLHYLRQLMKDHGYNDQQIESNKVPVVVCGDFNSQRNSAVYEMFHDGSVNKDHFDVKGRDYGFLTETDFRHPFNFKSSYEDIGELRFTNYTPSFVDVIDYIWYSPNNLRVRGLLGDIDKEYTDKFIGFPNDKFPSDHIPLLSRFEFF